MHVDLEPEKDDSFGQKIFFFNLLPNQVLFILLVQRPYVNMSYLE